jgi:hypothetical protein
VQRHGQRQRSAHSGSQSCSRLERLYIGENIICTLKTHQAIPGFVIFYNTGVVNRCRKIGSRSQSYDF